VVAISAHSPFTCSSPRNRKRSSRPAPLDLPKHRLHDRLARGVDRLAAHGTQLAIHPSPGIEVSRRSPPRWSGPMPVLLPARGDVGIQPSLFAGFQVGGAAVARIRDQRIWLLASVRLDPLQHRQQMHRIAGLIADADRHDHLVVSVHRGLSVVALDPAVSAFEDVAIGVGEVPLGGRLGVAGGGGRERALRHRRCFGRCCAHKLQACGLCLLGRQLLSVIGALASTTAAAGCSLAALLITTGLRFCRLLLGNAGLLLTLAGLGRRCLGLQLSLGLADLLQPAGATLQFLGQLVTSLALAVLPSSWASISSALRSRPRISSSSCRSLLSIRSWLMALCLLALARSLVPSSATWPRLTSPAF